METTSRSLRQEELDGYYRYEFVKTILDYIAEGKTAKFVAVKNHTSLVEIKSVSSGEWEFRMGRDIRGTYSFGTLIMLLEKVYDSGATVINLQDEIRLEIIHMTANADAEPSTVIDWTL